ncbi:hypothetical protein, partial [Aeromicrobium sp.]|uniref:hypothetical protein n=1 Tax=Aeromicrobium sp. TaxID=1871063 RepID=UPI0019C1ECB5
ATDVVTAAGDRIEAVGATAAPGGTRRAGDAVATLGSAVAGRGTPLRIVLEAKTRTRPLTVSQWRAELGTGRETREAVAGLGLVPTCDQVPGGGSFARVDELSYVVALDDDSALGLVYLVLRELVAATHTRDTDSEVDLTKLEAHLDTALRALEDFDDVGRNAKAAQRSLENILTTGAAVKARLGTSITAGLALLHD